MRFPGLAQSFSVSTFRMMYRVLRCIHTQFQMRLAVQWIYIWISLTFSCHCLKSLVNVRTTECYSGTVLCTGRFFLLQDFQPNTKSVDCLQRQVSGLLPQMCNESSFTCESVMAYIFPKTHPAKIGRFP